MRPRQGVDRIADIAERDDGYRSRLGQRFGGVDLRDLRVSHRRADLGADGSAGAVTPWLTRAGLAMAGVVGASGTAAAWAATLEDGR
jgi:hypothetical protein